jgi:hypothetical protein
MDISHMGKIYLTTFSDYCEICIFTREDDISLPKFHILDSKHNDLGCIGIYEAKYEGNIRLNDNDKITLNNWMKEDDPMELENGYHNPRWRIIAGYYNPNFLDRKEIPNSTEYIKYLRTLTQPDYSLL